MLCRISSKDPIRFLTGVESFPVRISTISSKGFCGTSNLTSDGTTTYILDTATPLTMVLSESTGASTTRYWHGLDTLAQSDGSSVEYFAYDGLGSVRQMVDTSGSVGLAQTFDPYGNGYAKAGSAASSLGFTGEQTDSNGFVFLRARYYQPGMGRFTQMDPSRQERNAYQYAASNRVMFVDLSGLACTEVGDAYYDWCKQRMSEMANKHSVTFIWPGGNSSDREIEILKKVQTCHDYQLGPYHPIMNTTPRLAHWMWTDIRAIYTALDQLSRVFPNSRRITEGGLFYLANIVVPTPDAEWKNQTAIYCDNRDSSGLIECQYGRSITFSDPNISYAIGLGRKWAEGDESSRVAMMLHELGHRTDHEFIHPKRARDVMYDRYKPIGLPRAAPNGSASEYYANTFARYIFEKRGLPINSFFGATSRDLDTIIDWKNDAPFRGMSLMWYMENRIVRPYLP